MEVSFNLFFKEGFNIWADIFILYNLKVNKVFDLFWEIGWNYENNVIFFVFWFIVFDVIVCYFVKDMYIGECVIIEVVICDQMVGLFEECGIFIEVVLIKSIQLFVNLAWVIEEKLEVEQCVFCMEFVLQEVQQEVQCCCIEVEGIWDV